ncbi:hypothetical protein GCM10007049_34840 [Echinicola pacifica]|uniref:Porin n=1 Tax=Echinicola pacifica TaxID=346377 RepID=A0A918UWD8_9BACT|nr:hypothetical protein [Echinicola pacifica]GGZ38710.1 hypothetical protein GCM10007049_34840 [Echinicola pacifica]
MKKFIICAAMSGLFFANVDAQETESSKFPKELKFKLNEDGSQYIKANFLNQIWLRYTAANPGSEVFGTADEHLLDVGLRRTRIVLYGQLTDRVFFYTQFGQNNLSYRSPRKQGLFFHDALAEYAVVKEKISLGAGLTGWNGVSRYSSPSVGSILGLDAPLYQQTTNDINDQFVRKFSVYAKGQLGQLDYRLAVSKPMSTELSTAQSNQLGDNSLFAAEPGYAQVHGYFKYMFWDKESNTTPYQAGSYLGQKRVMNIGAGFLSQKDAMWHYADNQTDTLRSNLTILSVDFFMDQPISASKGNAITAYAAYSYSDYGKNYIRNIGAMNPATGVNENGTFNGPGNAFPTIGTGNTVFAQLGYLFGREVLGKSGTLQAYFSTQYSDFDRLEDAMLMYDGGLNWLIDGNRVKLTMGYQSRPIFDYSNSGALESTSRKGMAVMQFQVAI